MPVNTNGLDYFNLGEPLSDLAGSVNTSSLDYFNLGEPYSVIASGASSAVIHYGTVSLYGVGSLLASGTKLFYFHGTGRRKRFVHKAESPASLKAVSNQGG